MGVKLQLQVRAKAKWRPMIFNLIYYMNRAFAISFKHGGILKCLLNSSYSPNVLLFFHGSENDSVSPSSSPRSTDKLIWFQSEHIAGSGTEYPHKFTHLHWNSSCSEDPPRSQAFISLLLLIIANRQHPPPTNQEKIPGPAVTYLKVEISWLNEKDFFLRGRKWGKKDVMMINFVAANRKWVIYDYSVVR